MIKSVSAKPSFLGYEYQSLQALLLIAPTGRESQIFIEKFDDVTFQQGEHKEVIQYKFSLNNTSNITAKSPELWKTLYNWITLIESNSISTDEYHFLIITTRNSEDEIILELTKEDSKRNHQEIVSNLVEVAKSIDNKEIKKYVDKFLTLKLLKQTKLLSNIQILVGQPDIIGTQNQIEEHLKDFTRPEFKESFFESIYGWWYKQIINRLSIDTDVPITHHDLIEAIHRHLELQSASALPIHFDNAKLTDKIKKSYENYRFVRQLELIKLKDKTIFESMLHYYKAFKQRSKWTRELQNIDQRLEKYDEELELKWKSEFDSIEREIDKKQSPTDSELIDYGTRLFEWMDKSNYYPDLKLENSLSKIWLSKGSYHMLSNECKVGWHPKFMKLLGCENDET